MTKTLRLNTQSGGEGVIMECSRTLPLFFVVVRVNLGCVEGYQECLKRTFGMFISYFRERRTRLEGGEKLEVIKR